MANCEKLPREVGGRADVIIAGGGHEGGGIVQRRIWTARLTVDPFRHLAEYLSINLKI
jgi:hypothetical protein